MSRYFLWEIRMLIVSELLLLMLKVLPKTPETAPCFVALIGFATTLKVGRVQ